MQNRNSRWLVITSLIIIAGAGVLFFNRKQTSLPSEHVCHPTEVTTLVAPDFLVTQQTNNTADLEKSASPKIGQTNVEIVDTETASLPQVISKKLAHEPYHIFFDVRHILLHSSGTTAAKAVGVSNMFWYTVKHKKTPNHLEIQARLFEFMDYCTKQPRGTALFNNEPMPALMCQWAKGELTAKQFLDTVLSYKKEIKEFFVSEEEKNLVLGTLEVFKPDVICNIQRSTTKMVNFFQECCQNFPGQIYILSNWDHESASLIRKQFPQIFEMLDQDHIIFSGDIGKLKPEPEIFNYVTQTMHLNPQKCILVDDSPENIRAAKALGWGTILHKTSERTTHKVKKILCIKSRPAGKTKKKKKK
jgi:hypothetical protein